MTWTALVVAAATLLAGLLLALAVVSADGDDDPVPEPVRTATLK